MLWAVASPYRYSPLLLLFHPGVNGRFRKAFCETFVGARRLHFLQRDSAHGGSEPDTSGRGEGSTDPLLHSAHPLGGGRVQDPRRLSGDGFAQYFEGAPPPEDVPELQIHARSGRLYQAVSRALSGGGTSIPQVYLGRKVGNCWRHGRDAGRREAGRRVVRAAGSVRQALLPRATRC